MICWMNQSEENFVTNATEGAVKKGDDLGGHGVCQKGNKTSEQYIGIV